MKCFFEECLALFKPFEANECIGSASTSFLVILDVCNTRLLCLLEVQEKMHHIHIYWSNEAEAQLASYGRKK